MRGPMATIETLQLPAATRPAQLWRSVAQAVRTWLAVRRVAPADAVLLLPFADLLAPARRALAEAGGWLPRVHTPRTLATALGPPRPLVAGRVTGDGAIDRATARDLLHSHSWAVAWLQRDPRAFDAALQRLVRTAHALRAAAIAQPPHARAAWWQKARQQVSGSGGVGATHRQLLRAAIEWCAIDDAADTDRLFSHRPAAWITLTIGGQDELALSLLREAAARGVPVLQLSADPQADDPFADWPDHCTFELEVAGDAEDEALATAWQLAQQVRAGATPVALVVQDRALVRRVRALLERQQIDVADETGWSLATTRAGAHAAAALRAARASGRPDDALDWLKADLPAAASDELSALETLWRGSRVKDLDLRARAEALWRRERTRLDAFAEPSSRPIGQWLHALDALLFGAEHSAARRDDAAAAQLRRALHLRVQDRAGWWDPAGPRWRMEAFAAWVDAALEEAVYLPPPALQAAPVIVTPLSRAIGREFAAAVLPGADETRLGLLPPDDGLLDEPLRRALGLPDRAARQRRAALSFVQLLRLPRVVALRRRADGDELVSVSPWVERLQLARRQRAAPLVVERDVQLPRRDVTPNLTPRPLPRATGALPPSFSASTLEALRQCPYRFFSRAALHLSEHDELDGDVDKRDAGKWLHATLERFHVERDERRTVDDDIARFVAASREALTTMARVGGTPEEAMLPFSATLRSLATRYVTWLHAQEAQGWRFLAAEVSVPPTPTGEAGLMLHGRIDRIDTRSGESGVRLIDYKTSPRKSLDDKVRAPLEDTQLAVYAALQLARHPDSPVIEACYLAIDDTEDPVTVMHRDVVQTARVLTERVAAERARIEAGAELPALGEGAVCETCEARGLCRRDHWGDGEEGAPGAA